MTTSTASLRASSSLPRRYRPRTGLLRCAPAYLLMLISAIISLFATFTAAAPLPNSDKDGDLGDNILGGAREGPYNISIQAGIAGAILIVLGIILCFFGYRIYHVTLFIVGFYFLGNLTYIGMANGGVTSRTLLLVVSIVVGVIGGILLIFCSRLGVAILGALAFYALGLWILGWRSGGVISSSSGRIALLVCLAILGFILGLFNEKEMVIVGSAIIGAYSFVIGVDMYVDTGFSSQADSFINSKNSVESHFENQTVGVYALLGTFLVLAALGMIVQFYSWGNRATWRPVPGSAIAPGTVVAPGAVAAPGTVAAPATDVVYTEKPPARFGGFFRRRY